jgi:hypothetical protein
VGDGNGDGAGPPHDGDLTDEQLARVDELIGYHSPLAHRLTTERTSYQSQMIPVTSYILVACCEAFLRYPDAMRTIAAAMDPAQVGAAGRRPGSRINTVHLWSIANFHLLGRKILAQFDPTLDRPADTLEVLEFWDAAARGFRGDGNRSADDTGGTIRVYDADVVEELANAAQPVGDAERAEVRRHLASLISYLFLLYFDTRVGSGDTGPYDLGELGLGPAGRTMIVRDFYQMGPSEFGWSDVAADVPYRHLVAGLVLDDVRARITDFGTVVTDPEDYLDRLVGISLFTTDGMAPGELRPVPLDELGDVAAACRTAERTLYRRIARMDTMEMVVCGAEVYFTFLRPFAQAAGVAEQIDWTVPQALEPPVVDLLVAAGEQVGETSLPDERPETYYPPYR